MHRRHQTTCSGGPTKYIVKKKLSWFLTEVMSRDRECLKLVNFCGEYLPSPSVALAPTTNHPLVHPSNLLRSFMPCPLSLWRPRVPSRNEQILILRGNALRGRLPAWLDQLRFLRHVDLADNSFEGSVPASLATLPHLEVLLLHGNKLDGAMLLLTRWRVLS